MGVLDTLKAASPNRCIVSIIVDGALQAEWDDLRSQLEAAAIQDEAEGSMASALPNTTRVVEAMEAIRDRVEASRVEFHVEQVSWTKRVALQAEFPPRDNNPFDRMSGYNSETFPPALIRASVKKIVGADGDELTDITDDVWSGLLGGVDVAGSLNFRAVNDLMVAAKQVNDSETTVPLSARSLLENRDTGTGSTSPSPGEQAPADFAGWEPTFKTEYHRHPKGHEYEGEVAYTVTTTVEPEWDEETRNLALGHAAVHLCSVCGGPAYLCQDVSGEFNWEVPDPVRCHKLTALRERQAGMSEKTNPHLDALVWSVRNNGGSSMADRSVDVRLRLDISDFSRNAALVGRQTDLMAARLKSMDKSTASFSRSVGNADASLDSFRDSTNLASTDLGNFGKAADDNGNKIDKLSGRIQLIAEAAALVGPGLIPIGAVGIPALTGLASMGGLAALAIGTLVGSINGVGDALKAVDAAELNPTVSNLQKAELLLDNLSPSAANFVQNMDEFQEVFRQIRNAGQAGWFPGLSDAMEELTTLGPELERMFGAIGAAGGQAVAGAAGSLSSKRWAPFLDFLTAEAPTAIDNLSRILGGFTHGLAQMWMQFQPTNNDFAVWLGDVADGFDRWTTSAEGRADIRSFLDYVKENGPGVQDFFLSLVDSLTQIVQAAAPLGGPVLTSLTKILEVVASIADSDLGTPIFAGLAALSLYNRALAVTARLSKTAFMQGAGGPGASGVSAGLGGAFGGQVAALKAMPAAFRGATVAQDAMTAAQRTSAAASAKYTGMLKAQNSAIATGFQPSMMAMNRIAAAQTQAEVAQRGVTTATLAHKVAEDQRRASLASGAATIGKTAALMGGLTLATTGLGEETGLSNTASLGLMGTLAGPWGAAIGAAIGLTSDFAGANDDLQESLLRTSNIAPSDPIKVMLEQRNELLKEFQDTINADGFGGAVSRVSSAFFGDDAEFAAQTQRINDFIAARRELNSLQEVNPVDELSGYFVEMNGVLANSVNLFEDFQDAFNVGALVLDQRDKMRQYQEALDGVAGAVEENGKAYGKFSEAGRANQEVLDGLITKGLAVAAAMKPGAARETFLKNLRKEARDAGAALGATDKEVRELLIDLGLIEQIKPVVEPKLKKDPFLKDVRQAQRGVQDLDKQRADPLLDLLMAPFGGKVKIAKGDLKRLDGEKANPFLSLFTVDFDGKARKSKKDIDGLDKERPEPLLDLLTGNFDSAYDSSKRKIQDLNNDTATVTIITEHRSVYTGGKKKAGGGPITGPGGPRDDQVPIMASNGEFMIKAEAVSHYGVGTFHALNAMRLADGGLVGGGWAPQWGSGGTGDGGSRDRLSFNMGPQLAGLGKGLRALFEGINDLKKKELEKRKELIEKETAQIEKQADRRLAQFEREMKSKTRELDKMERIATREAETRDRIARKIADADKERLKTTEAMNRAFQDQVKSTLGVDVFAKKDRYAIGNGQDGEDIALPADFLNLDPTEQLRILNSLGISGYHLSSLATAPMALTENIERIREALRLYAELTERGFGGPAFQALVGNADVETLQAYAALPDSQLDVIETQYGVQQDLLNQAGQFAGDAVYGADIREPRVASVSSLAELRLVVAENKVINTELKEMRRDSAKVGRQVAKDIEQGVASAINAAAHAGATGRTS